MPTYSYKMFRVKKNLQPSSISMDPLLASLALQRMTAKELKNLVQSLVDKWCSTNPTEPCSTFVSQHLKQHLVSNLPYTD